MHPAHPSKDTSCGLFNGMQMGGQWDWNRRALRIGVAAYRQTCDVMLILSGSCATARSQPNRNSRKETTLLFDRFVSTRVSRRSCWKAVLSANQFACDVAYFAGENVENLEFGVRYNTVSVAFSRSNYAAQFPRSARFL